MTEPRLPPCENYQQGAL